jgi:serine/threonine-protein kinase
MASVWEAEHLELSTRVAVKLVAPERMARGSATADRLVREAKLAARLTHPHVVRVLERGALDDGTPFFVMERLHGETLAARLERSGPLSTRAAVQVVAQVASALAEAHGMGIVHRDLKPQNLFLVESDYDLFVKVLDFGVAKEPLAVAAPALTTDAAVLGTPWYMAPEQLAAPSKVDLRADLWSLGVVAYEALTSVRPFDGPTLAALSMAICAGSFRPPSEVRPELPRALDAWFGRALAVAAEDRFESASDMARDLVEAAGLDLSDAAPTLRREDRVPSPSTTAAPTTSGRVDLPTTEAPSAGPARRQAPARSMGSRAAALGVAAAAGLAVWAGLAQQAPPLDRARSGTSQWHSALAFDTPTAAATAAAPAPTPFSPAAATATTTAANSARSGRPIASAPPAAPSASESARGAVVRPPKPAYCETEAGFRIDADGHLVPRPECL